jgi:glycosyltransferase involved in cell wall biosynthesis
MCSRAPETGQDTEVVFLVGGSADAIYETIAREMVNYRQRRCALLRQNGQGGGNAVRPGFSKTGGEVLMILDVDLMVHPEDLPRFYRALLKGKGEFINGVRLVCPMQQQTMRPANLFGNKLLSCALG